MLRLSLCCLLVALSFASAAAPHEQYLIDQTAPVNSEVSVVHKDTSLQQLDANVTCKTRCNDVDVSDAQLDVGAEAKSCVGVLTIFCKSNDTDGIFGAKCEGKATMLADSTTISICEGSFATFGKRGIKTPSGDYVKRIKAFGCLGTAIGVSPNKSASSDNIDTLMLEGVSEEDLVAMDSTLAGKDTTREGRCNGFSGRFEGFKVGGKCNKHKGPKHGDKNADRPHRPTGDEPRDFDPEAAQFDMPGARRSLSEHHDHHDKHHGEKRHGDKHHGKGTGKHHDLDSERHGHHKGWKDAVTTFEDLEGKVQHHMHKAGVELLPHDVPSGSVSGPPKCSITCNGRPTWFGAFFPCFGKLEIDCEVGSKAPASISGSSLDVARPGFAIQGRCQGFWSGALFKTCRGFSTAHVETRDKDAWDFCSGKNAVRMGGAPGKGFFSGSWCRGQYLAVVEKESEDSL